MNIKYISRPEINIEIYDCGSEKEKVWDLFKHHHYLTAKINKSSRCFLACWNSIPVGFYAVLALPSGTVKNAFRGHRLVVLSDYQGLGIGNRLSEWVGELLKSEGKRFFCKTANVKLGLYRDKSSKWRKTSKHRKKLSHHGVDRKKLINPSMYTRRICFTHEYIG